MSGQEDIHLVVAPPRRLRRAQLEGFAGQAHSAVKLRGALNVLLTDSSQMKDLNRRFRQKNKTTDVLSFPAPAALRKQLAGDLAINVDLATGNAKSFGHSTTAELCILMMHGMLHLAGHDHETDDGAMAALEMKLRKRLGLPLGLIERTLERTRERTSKGARR